jgi:UDP-N-acetylmuramyl pentapeptide synthase
MQSAGGSVAAAAQELKRFEDKNAELEELLWQAEVMQDSLSDELEVLKQDHLCVKLAQRTSAEELMVAREVAERLEEEVEQLQRELAAVASERRRGEETKQRDIKVQLYPPPCCVHCAAVRLR